MANQFNACWGTSVAKILMAGGEDGSCNRQVLEQTNLDHKLDNLMIALSNYRQVKKVGNKNIILGSCIPDYAPGSRIKYSSNENLGENNRFSLSFRP